MSAPNMDNYNPLDQKFMAPPPGRSWVRNVQYRYKPAERYGDPLNMYWEVRWTCDVWDGYSWERYSATNYGTEYVDVAALMPVVVRQFDQFAHVLEEALRRGHAANRVQDGRTRG